MLASLLNGGKSALAAALARIEESPDSVETVALLDAAYVAARAHVVGITGPPGVGKSSLAGALIPLWRASGRRVGVIAVDPTSRQSGGALLGDRTRLATDPEDDGVFVRSMAARERLGGLSALTMPAAMVMRALYDLLVVETVGVGQSETEIAALADTVVLCVQPGSGDSLQFMKAGVVEIPHVVVVTKADMGAAARRARADVEGALGLSPARDGWTTPVLDVSTVTRSGFDALIDALDRRWRFLAEAGRLADRRHGQAESWLAATLRERFGREGARKAGAVALAAGEPPFGRLSKIVAALART
ncbi:MAG TPA: methylmalonyl Co-A mutase-associated GTPase MeaB [Alphaproteobacteria bacterium]